MIRFKELNGSLWVLEQGETLQKSHTLKYIDTQVETLISLLMSCSSLFESYISIHKNQC